MNLPFALHELGNSSVDPDSRYVVSLVIGYTDQDVISPVHAVASALDATRDGNAFSTVWWVYDRQTGLRHRIEQSAVDAYCAIP